jgi:hypothetical protein
MSIATHFFAAQTFKSEAKPEMTKQEVAHHIVMWTLLALNVMAITAMEMSKYQCAMQG